MNKLFTIFGYMLVALLVIPIISAAEAASLQFDPATVSTTNGSTFEVKVNVNAGSEQVTTIDAYVSFDSSLLEASSVKNGTFFPTVYSDTSKTGKVYVAGIVDDPATSKTGTGTVATVVFKAKKDGSGTLTFDCTQGSSTDSNISKNDANATDVIECSANGRSTITVGSGGSSPTNTPTPTTAGGGGTAATATPTPTRAAGTTGGTTGGGTTARPTAPASLPQSGITENIPLYSTVGILMVLVGVGVRLLL